jgi:hypothetical protein
MFGGASYMTETDWKRSNVHCHTGACKSASISQTLR